MGLFFNLLSVSATGDLWLTGVLTALAISVDSCCAAATDAPRIRGKHRWLILVAIAAIFAVFHFITPVIGYSIGSAMMEVLEGIIGPISCGILCFLGLKELAEIVLEWHVDRMDAIGDKYAFAAASHIRELVDAGQNLKQIKSTLRIQSSSFKFGVFPSKWCGEGSVETPEQMYEFGIYLRHLSRWLTRSKLREILHPKTEEQKARETTTKLLLAVAAQAVATSLDALAVGFTYAETPIAQAYPLFAMFTGVVFVISFLGGALGKILGERSQRVANLVGSLVLIGLGIKALF